MRRRKTRRNPLVSYSSSVAVGSGDRFSPLESTFLLGGLLVVGAGALYLWMKNQTPAVAPGVQPVPTPAPVQPVSPSSPGY